MPSLGQIATDFCEADQRARAIVNRLQHDARPKGRTIFAYAPALLFGPARARGRGEIDFRAPILHGRSLVEHRKMLTYDLLRRVAIDMLSASVPARPFAGRVAHGE